ncbi:MAG: RluA family pseudouridine synthase [Oligoflexia bacterium]|nr:RluA family pseudouridine synthase [Oligoflexia bacterium]
MTTSWSWKIIESPSERADRAVLRAIEKGLGQWSEEGSPVACSRSQIQRLIEEGRVTVDETPLKANAKLRAGSLVRVEFPPPRPTEILAEDRPLDILFQDEHIVVVNKPPGLTVHPSETQADGTLVNALLHHIKDLSGIGGELRPGIVHRIDKDTSGALVISKSDEAHRALVKTFAEHAIERVYWALCYGAPAGSGRTTIDTRIGRNPADRKKMAVLKLGGRRAVSHFEKLEEYGIASRKPFASWLAVTLETGRTHQVRVHLTSIGHSLLSDPVYGTPTNTQAKWTALPHVVQEAARALPGQALHARVLGFRHPITGAPLRFEAEPPEGFVRLHSALGEFRGESAGPR